MQCSAHALFGTRDLPDTPAPAPAQPPRTPQLVFACPPRSPRTLAPHALAQACVWLAKSGGREAHTPAGHLQGRPGFGARPRRPLRPVPAGGVGLVGVRAVCLRSLSEGRAVETEQQEAAQPAPRGLAGAAVLGVRLVFAVFPFGVIRRYERASCFPFLVYC